MTLLAIAVVVVGVSIVVADMTSIGCWIEGCAGRVKEGRFVCRRCGKVL